LLHSHRVDILVVQQAQVHLQYRGRTLNSVTNHSSITMYLS
jgi:hypothetical protein